MKSADATKTKSWIPRNPAQTNVGNHGKCVIRTAFMLLSFLWCQPVWGIAIDPLTPAPGTPGLSAPPEMKAWVSGLGGQGGTVRLFRRVAPPATRQDFSVVIMGDTQFYTNSGNGGRPETFYSQTDWIVANRQSLNIACVLHTGDLVQTGGQIDSEWQVASNAMYRLANPVTTGLVHGIPFSISVGDHDGNGVFANYNKYFGVTYFSGRSYYGGHFGTDNTNHYILFSAGGMDFIVLALQEHAGTMSAVMSWANNVLQAHSNRRAIIISHNLLYPGGEWTADGRALYEGIKTNTNVFLMHCGHDPQWGIRSDTYGGNKITTLLGDYENEPNGGNGWLRYYVFKPGSNMIQMKTFSPKLNQYKGTVYHEYAFPYNMTIPDPAFSLVATRTVAADGVVNFGTFTDLVKSTSYDWYVTVEQAGVVTQSQTWNFSTASDYSRISYAAEAAASPAFSDPIALEGTFQTASGYPAIIWKSKGGRRYRVEYRDVSGPPSFIAIVRSISLETDPAPAGIDSYQVFVDDGSLTGGASTARVYQVREMAPIQPLEIIRIIKPTDGNPAIIWHSVGGRRYRVEYSNVGGSGLEFHEIPRSQAVETDPAPEGSASFQIFVDDGTFTGGDAASRFYRVREVP